jgi:hypothetical protein
MRAETMNKVWKISDFCSEVCLPLNEFDGASISRSIPKFAAKEPDRHIELQGIAAKNQ